MSFVLAQRTIEIATPGPGLFDITREVARVVGEADAAVGMCSVFVVHTSASLIIQENADPAVLRDLTRWLERIAPEGGGYEHDDEGPDDMPAHLRGTITRTGEVIPVHDGLLMLGPWQAVYLCEHRRRPHRRRVVVTVVGDKNVDRGAR
jgi:secondary thiamine-phosphate synthase enzyme